MPVFCHMASAAWSALKTNVPAATCVIEDGDDEYACFDINSVPALHALISQRFAAVQYVQVELLEPENEEIVFELTLIDINQQVLTGAELSKDALYWDDAT